MSSTPRRLVIHGVLFIVIGVIAVVWPDITIGAFVILFGANALVDGVFAFADALTPDRSASSRPWQIVLGLVDVAAAVIAVTWPDITALTLVIVMAVWAVVAGALQIAMAFGPEESGRERWFFVLTGLLFVGLGIAFAARPDIGALTIATVFGFFSLVAGSSMLVTASWLRSEEQEIGRGLKVG